MSKDDVTSAKPLTGDNEQSRRSQGGLISWAVAAGDPFSDQRAVLRLTDQHERVRFVAIGMRVVAINYPMQQAQHAEEYSCREEAGQDLTHHAVEFRLHISLRYLLCGRNELFRAALGSANARAMRGLPNRFGIFDVIQASHSKGLCAELELSSLPGVPGQRRKF